MKRREFVALIGAAATRPFIARAQQLPIPVIGVLASATFDYRGHLAVAFRRALNELGYVEGHTVDIEYHSANGQYDRLPTLAAALVRDHVAIIVTTGAPASALAAKAATTTLPIVFVTGGDAVGLGLVA